MYVPDYNKPWGLSEEGTDFREPDWYDDQAVKEFFEDEPEENK
jgi:hypothetical protein